MARLVPIFTALLLLLTSQASGVVRGMPEGEAAVEVGSPAPLVAEDLKKAHAEKKAILLMFGNPDHCIFCEKVWRHISELQEASPNDVAAILKVHRASKFWGPESDAVALGRIYGVAGEPWLFLIDRDGVLRRIYKGVVEKEEIEADLKKAIEGKD
jgi:thioredoxin-related protein